MVKVKICGITNREDALVACEAGADALGFVFFKGSPRFVNVEKAREIVNSLPPFVTTVGVFVDEGLNVIRRIVEDTGLDTVQLHGSESPEFCESLSSILNRRIIKAFKVKSEISFEPSIFRLDEYHVSAYLLDTYQEDKVGGTGRTFDWDVAVKASAYGRIILSGGLNPDNIKEAVERVKPYAVDVSSGIEVRPGKKDLKKVKEFIERAKRI